MNKQILVVGGGISGLAVLHFLKKKHAGRSDVQIHLLEKSGRTGGTVRTLSEEGFRFECGPNGFLSNTPETFELIEDVGLRDSVISADEKAKIRYIAVKNRLHRLPAGFFSFLAFRPLSLGDKLRILGEPFVKKGGHPEETVYEFGARRLGGNFSKYFLDPMVSGIFAGNARTLSLKASFPKIYNLEQAFGSLIKGAIALKKSRKKEKTPFGQPRGTLTSFKGGMEDLIVALQSRYREHIMPNVAVKSVARENEKFIVSTDGMMYAADEIFLSVPAHQAAPIVAQMDATLSESLLNIPYAAVAVAGFAYRGKDLAAAPEGFGYLIPSSENRKVLGVLFSSNIFKGRALDGCVLFQVMVGGSNHPDILNYSHEQIKKLAKDELESMLGIRARPVREFFVFCPQGIPQYNRGYQAIVETVNNRLAHWRGLSLTANYLGGISLNDCVANAKRAAEKSYV